jgi:hypothetical protein
MFRSKGNRLPRILITVFTILAVMVSFCLGAAEPLRDAGFGAEGTGGADGSVDSFIPAPAEKPAILIKTGEHQFTPPQTGFQRIFNLWGTHGGTCAFYRASLGKNSNINYIDVKNTILLKLRI